MNFPVKIKLLTPAAKMPHYATQGSAAADLSAALDSPTVIPAGETVMIPTGIAISMGRCDMVALIYARSGLASKSGVAPANCVGVIDSDYRGEIKVALHNHSKNDFTVNPGDRIAQLLFSPVYQGEFETADSLDDTDRGDGGFGSTGVKG
jgi:dUTP pyrophosphatase